MLTKTVKPIICLLLIALLPVAALADKITMKNGDIISGTLGKVTAEKVFIKPDYTDEFAVAAAEVVAIEPDTDFEVELLNGDKFVVKFAGTQGSDQLLLVGDKSRNIPISRLATVTKTKPYYQRLSHVDLSLTINSGNTDSQNIMFFADSLIEVGKHRHLAKITFRREETNNISTKEQDLLDYQYNSMFNDPWYTGITAGYERDPIRDLDYRYSIAAIFGRDVFNDDDRLLAISVGAGYSGEKIAETLDSGAVSSWNLIYNQDIKDGEIKFFHNQSLAYQFFGNNNTIFKTNTGFQFSLIKDIYAKVSLRYDYETEPATGTSKDDTTLAIGIGAKF